MARVAPDDDSVRRFLVRRYAYDPDRHERRHIVVAAYDNAGEFEEHFQRQNRELRGRRARGEPVDPREHVSGICLEPGDARRQAAARVVRAAIAHGVLPPDSLLHEARGATGFEFLRARRVDPPDAGGA